MSTRIFPLFPAWPAGACGELEALVEDRLGAFLRSETDVYAAIEPEGADATKSSDHISRAAELAQTWPELPPAERRRILLALLARVDIHRESVEIRIFCHGLLSILEGENVSLDRKHPADENARAIIWTIPVACGATLCVTTPNCDQIERMFQCNNINATTSLSYQRKRRRRLTRYQARIRRTSSLSAMPVQIERCANARNTRECLGLKHVV